MEMRLWCRDMQLLVLALFCLANGRASVVFSRTGLGNNASSSGVVAGAQHSPEEFSGPAQRPFEAALTKDTDTKVVNVQHPYFGFNEPPRVDRGQIGKLSPNSNVFYPVSKGYEQVRKPWQTFYQCNAYPELVVQVGTAGDVVKTLEYAKSRRRHVTIRNGGHSYAGISRSYGLVLDVSPMTDITTVKESDGTSSVYVGAGQLNIGVYSHLCLSGLAIPAGGCPSVGISGLTLGGGFGVLSRKFGLTSDQVLELEAVVWLKKRGAYAVVTANATNQYSDLFFAFRGGMGGNYGVVTRWKFRTAPVEAVQTAEFRLDLTEARAAAKAHHTKQYDYVTDAIVAFMAWCDSANENVNCEMSISSNTIAASQVNANRSAAAQIQEPSTFNLESICLCNDGDCGQCAGEVAVFQQTLETINQRSPSDLYSNSSTQWPWNKFVWIALTGCESVYNKYNASWDEHGNPTDPRAATECAEMEQTRVGRGKHNRKRSLFLNKSPSGEFMEVLIRWFDDFAKNVIVDTYTAVNMEFYYWGGALATPPPGATKSAWDHRDQKWLVHITGRFTDDASPQTIANVYYALGVVHRKLNEAFQSTATRLQDYQNFVDATLNYEAWSSFYFKPDTLKKLRAVAGKYDPDDIFRNQLSIPPGGTGTTMHTSTMLIVLSLLVYFITAAAM